MTKESLQANAIRCGIPDYMQEGLIEYVLHGNRVGNFLTAVLTNDLKEACARADETNLQLLPNYVKFLYNHTPLGCWGAEDRVESWMERGGFEGIMQTERKKVKA